MNHSTQEKVSMTSTVLEQLRQEINNCLYVPGQFLTETEISQKFGVSKSTVHKDDGVIIRIEFQGMRKAPVLRV